MKPTGVQIIYVKNKNASFTYEEDRKKFDALMKDKLNITSCLIISSISDLEDYATKNYKCTIFYIDAAGSSLGFYLDGGQDKSVEIEFTKILYLFSSHPIIILGDMRQRSLFF